MNNSMKVQHCKACGAPIIFIKSPGGKHIPCDAEPVTYWEQRGARGKVVTPNGMVVSCVFEGETYPTGIGYRTHFATCPEAASFRRERRHD